MKVSEIIESQYRKKDLESKASLKEAIEANKPIWDAVSLASSKSHLAKRDNEVEFKATIEAVYSDGTFFWVYVDEHVTDTGIKWITNFLADDSIKEIVSTLQKGDRVLGISNNFKVVKIEKL